MTAIWMRARAELRVHIRAWLLLALVIGIAGGAATAAAAGARRTTTAYPRFFEAYEGAHAVTGGLGDVEDPQEAAALQRALATLPQVETASQTAFVSDRFVLSDGTPVVFPQAVVTGDPTGKHLVEMNRAKVLSGRMFKVDAPDEAVIDLIAAERTGVEPGDQVDVLLFDETFAPTVRRTVTVVGVVVAPGGIPSVGEATIASLTVSPGFLSANASSPIDDLDGPNVRLRGGTEDLDAYIAGARRIAPGLDFPVVAPRHIAGVQKMLRYDAASLWILCALLALAAFVILGQALSRQLAIEGEANGTHAALGMSRGQLLAGDLLRAGVAGVLGAAVAVPVAIASSALTPRGLARLVDPDLGIAIDAQALVAGAAATALGAVLAATIPAIRLARRIASVRVARPSRVARMIASAGAAASAVAGIRLALDTGGGRRSVPVRSTVVGLVAAIASVAAAATFATSFDTLVARPELYGFTWDVLAGSEDPASDAKLLARDPDVELAAPGGYGNILIGGRQLLPLVYEPGTIEPTLLEGRAPRGKREIALGTALLSELGLRIGDTVPVRHQESDAAPVPFEIVGRVVVPAVFFQQVAPGESTAMTLEALHSISPPNDDPGLPHLIRYRRGVDVRAKIAQLRQDIPDLFVGQIREPGAELSAIARSADLPVILTIVLLLMGIGTLSHTLVSSIRTRRRDLAILKALGFVTGQVRSAVAWQSSTLVGIALALGIPAGIIAGRWGWRWFADTLGVVPQPFSPLLLTLVALPAGALLLANAISLPPGRRAARMRAADALHVE